MTYTAVTQEGIHPPPCPPLSLVGLTSPHSLGEQHPVWYLMEPIGLSLTHNCKPNFTCHPFAKLVDPLMKSQFQVVCVGVCVWV